MTARLTLNTPFMLGFEQMERMADRLGKASGDGFQPNNIEQVGGNGLRITLAVAGFSAEFLTIQVEGNQLVVRGRQPEDAQERVFLHRGIAARQFQKSFLLADGVEVDSATIDNGLLHIELNRPLPKNTIRRVEIRKTDAGLEQSNAVTVESTRTARVSAEEV